MAREGNAGAFLGGISFDAAIAPVAERVQKVLETIRRHLGMDIGFVSEFRGEDRVIRYVDADMSRPVLAQGEVISLREGLCRKIVAGELPGLMRDTAEFPEALAAVRRLPFPIGGHLSVPLLLSDGSLYGTFCCFSTVPDPSLTMRDLATLRAFAEVAMRQIESEILAERIRAGKADRIRSVLASTGPAILYQPIFGLPDLAPIEAEALSRFPGSPPVAPDVWFSEAADVGLGPELELRAVDNAVRGFETVWRRTALPLGVNLSARTILSGGFGDLFARLPTERMIIEITEHEQVESYEALALALAPIRRRGARIAIDDAGSGYASMRHVLALRPDIVKLDISLIRNIDADPMLQAMAQSLVLFSKRVGCVCIAEGVETAGELQAIREIGFDAVQGYHLSAPMPLDKLQSLVGI